jgi:2-keto-4-pentenoate hydratase/2-oxohepta-3-ene-1,7-dioic acid hydratase in catechol pathway
MGSWLAAPVDVWEAASESIRFVSVEFLQEGFTTGDIFVDKQEISLLAPIQRPGKVICIAGNFPAAGKPDAPQFPIVFLKPSSSVTGPGMPVCIPEIAASVAVEVELAVVMARKACRITTREASLYIGGYTLANDLGDRNLEKRSSQWTSGKMFDTFTPLGPLLVTPDEVPDPQTLSMETWVNDQLVQSGHTGGMFFGVHALVSYLSHLTTLESGDIILTGSPKMMNGEPAPSVALKDGDNVRIAINSLGEMTNPVRKEPA